MLDYTGSEEFENGICRYPVLIDLEMGKNNGIITTMKASFFSDTGAYSSDGPHVLGLMVGSLVSLYKIPNYEIDAYCIYTNNPVCGAYRGYRNPYSGKIISPDLAEGQIEGAIQQGAGID